MKVWIVLMLLTCGRPAMAAAQTPADPFVDSVALEAAGNLPKARAVLVQAFGALPDRYDACMRIAWLSLRLKDATQAVTLYRHARTLPEAGDGAAEGLVSALTAAGYQALARGDLSAARRDWDAAISIDASAVDAIRGRDLVGPVRGGAVEVWIAHFAAHSSNAQSFYLQAPVRINASLSIRGAYRQIARSGAIPVNATPPFTLQQTFFGSQKEFYGGATVEHGVMATEVVAFGLRNILEHVAGGALATRIGGRYGLSLMASGLHRPSGSNTQALPQLFFWPRPWLRVAAGARVTRDPLVSSTSAVAGGTLRLHAISIDAQVHIGPERWAFALAGPTILSFTDRTTRGGTMTAWAPAGRSATLFFQGQVERIQSLDGNNTRGRYLSLAAGVRWESGHKEIKR